jgi:hypothetical protein
MTPLHYLTVLILLAAANAFAQGQFTFANKNLVTTPPIDAKMVGPDCLTPLEGTAYWTQPYVKLAPDPDSSYAPVGIAVNFRTGNNAGYIVPVVVTTPYVGGTSVNVQMRVWEASGGPTYESAVAAGKFYGMSFPVTLSVTVAPAVPADMIGLTTFCLIPEPTSIALAALAAVMVLGWRRDRTRG